MNGQLSTYFTWREAVFSETAARLGIDNTPPAHIQENIRAAAVRLDRVRELLAVPMIVSSWYRCPPVNRAVGSSSTSDHLTGWAIDFAAPRYGSPRQVFAYLKPAMRDLLIDQLILEFPDSPTGGWVHISLRPGPRFQALLIDHTGTAAA